jgi:hypothetical protein
MPIAIDNIQHLVLSGFIKLSNIPVMGFMAVDHIAGMRREEVTPSERNGHEGATPAFRLSIGLSNKSAFSKTSNEMRRILAFSELVVADRPVCIRRAHRRYTRH